MFQSFFLSLWIFRSMTFVFLFRWIKYRSLSESVHWCSSFRWINRQLFLFSFDRSHAFLSSSLSTILVYTFESVHECSTSLLIGKFSASPWINWLVFEMKMKTKFKCWVRVRVCVSSLNPHTIILALPSSPTSRDGRWLISVCFFSSIHLNR
jgi:hypothetical protein